uniref:Uncharacterized protein n=2 Tax=Candidatus Bipolaricaulota TaxID=67810 RepID=H5SHB3_9BACT|nr:hypothetical protein HGMM_F28H07C23 [uncultured Acetothermia bacterium]BAL58956.1 hypothetical protein HGMM_OP3C111 [Candidatus Acetothermum autotrophicum]
MKGLGVVFIVSELTGGCTSLISSSSTDVNKTGMIALSSQSDIKKRFQQAAGKLQRELVDRVVLDWKKLWKSSSQELQQAFQTANDSTLVLLEHLEDIDIMGSLKAMIDLGPQMPAYEGEILRALRKYVVKELKEMGFSAGDAEKAINIRMPRNQNDYAAIQSTIKQKGLSALLRDVIIQARYELFPQLRPHLCAASSNNALEQSFRILPECGGGGGSSGSSGSSSGSVPINGCTVSATIAILGTTGIIIICASSLLAALTCAENIAEITQAETVLGAWAAGQCGG